jgi:hypothetical protein
MKYIATTVVGFPAGADLGLSKEQAALRGHCIAAHPKRKGWYTTTGPLQFKVGEHFLYDGDMPKSMASMVEPADKPTSKAEQEAKAKSDREAREKAAAIEAADAAVADAEVALARAGSEEATTAATTQLDAAIAARAAIES